MQSTEEDEDNKRENSSDGPVMFIENAPPHVIRVAQSIPI